MAVSGKRHVLRPLPHLGVYPSGRAARHTRGHPALVPPYLRHPSKRAGVDEIKVKLLLGHSLKGNVTATYIHPTPADLAKEVKKLA